MALSKLTQFDFHQTLAEKGGVSLVMFTAPGCGSCRQLRHALESAPDALGDIKLFEVDAQEDLALTREFDVFHLPSMFLFKDGQFHAQIEAEPMPQHVAAAVQSALAGGPQEAP